VCVNLTQVCVNLTQVCVNLTQACVNLTQACVNLTQACVNLTQACVNLTQACVNLTQAEREAEREAGRNGEAQRETEAEREEAAAHVLRWQRRAATSSNASSASEHRSQRERRLSQATNPPSPALPLNPRESSLERENARLRAELAAHVALLAVVQSTGYSDSDEEGVLDHAQRPGVEAEGMDAAVALHVGMNTPAGSVHGAAPACGSLRTLLKPLLNCKDPFETPVEL
jgi:hypothetical protein